MADWLIEVDRNAGAGYEDWTDYVEPWPKAVIDNIAAAQAGEASLPFVDPPATPENDWGVRITRLGAEVFEGIIRGVEHQDLATPGGPRVEIISVIDFTSLLDNDVVPRTWRGVAETAGERIRWLVETFGTHGITAGAECQDLIAMPEGIDGRPEQEFGPSTLRKAILKVTRLSGGAVYVDFDKKLHHYVDEAIFAPFAMSDDPDDVATFGYFDFKLEDDHVPRVDEVVVYGAPQPDGGLLEVTRTVVAPPPPERRRRAPLVDETLTSVAEAEAAGDAFLAENSGRRSGSFKTLQPGLRAGQTVQITHTGHGLVDEPFRIRWVRSRPDSPDAAVYDVQFGDERPSLASLLGGSQAVAQQASAVATEARRQLADLSVAGANLVPNSSFENAAAPGWTVGAGWVLGLDPADPQTAFQGSKVARGTAAASDLGALLTPFIAVDRLDDYWFSAWSFLRAYTSATPRIRVREYNAAGDEQAQTVVAELAAAEAAWTRHSIRFGPNDQLGRVAFDADTTQVRIEFDGVGVGTFSWDIDGVQAERGKLLTAYAPSPQELVDQQVGTTQIADDAVTTAKLIANAVVAGKIAASAVTADKIAALAVIADKIAAGAVTAAKLSIGNRSSGNVLGNPGFEDGTLTGWDTAWNGSGAWIGGANPTAAKSGSYSCSFTLLNNTQLGNIASQSFPVVAGQVYHCVFWEYASAVTAAGRYFQISFANAENHLPGQQVSSVDIGTPNGGISPLQTWVKREGYFTVPAGVTWARLAIYQYASQTGWGSYPQSVHFDDLQIRLVAGGVKNAQTPPAEVTIDGNGIRVTRGDSVVIIDGTSNMFKIVHSESMSLSIPAGSGSSQTLSTVTALGSLPVTPAHLSTISQGNTNASRQQIGRFIEFGLLYGNQGSGGGGAWQAFRNVNWEASISTELNGSGQVVLRLGGSSTSGTDKIAYSRTNVFKEAAM